ncbi:MAG TPA: ROK family protein [Anaerolineae bacterium]|nr:ROK family protein [Anaerolineae bacterium]
MNILGIDIGGSGIKGAIVDTEVGELVTERIRIPTPESFAPDEVIATVKELYEQFDYEGPVGVGFPAVVLDGVVMTPATAYQIQEWVGLPVAERISAAIGQPAAVLNDADVAGLAELHFGAGRERKGVVMLFTLGTGVGSVMFVNGRLVPNLELGHIYLAGQKNVAEAYMAERIRDEKDLSWKKWGKRLNKYFNHIERIFSPNLIIIGGGVSKKHHKFLHRIKVRAKVVPAEMRNEAGIVGAALAALPE